MARWAAAVAVLALGCAAETGGAGRGGDGGGSAGSGGTGGGGSGGSGLPRFELRLADAAPEGDSTYALGIGDDGRVIGYAAPDPFHPTARPVTVAADGSLSLLPVDHRQSGYAHGAGPGGVVVGEQAWQATIWTSGPGEPLRTADGWFSGVARAVGPGGLVVGSLGDYDDPLSNPGPRPYRWAHAGAEPVKLRTLSAEHDVGAVVDVSSGVLAGYLDTPAGARAVRWPTADAAPEPIPEGDGVVPVEATAIAAGGDVVGRGVADGGNAAFHYDARAGVTRRLPGLPGGGLVEAADIADDGTIVGVSGGRAAIWIDGEVHLLEGLVALPETVLALKRAAGVTSTGLVAVEAELAGGRISIAVLTPVE